jgi:hypothetical protein
MARVEQSSIYWCLWLAGCSGVQQQAELKTRPFQFSPRMGVENDAACWVGRGFPARFYFISSRTEFSSPDALFFFFSFFVLA